MTRSKNATKTKDVVEMEHNSNDIITFDAIKSIFQEMIQQQEKVLIETVNSVSLVANQRIDKLSSDITINNEKLIKLANDVIDVELSIEASQETIEEKIKKLKRELIKKKNEISGIVVKFSSYKTKEMIVKNARKLKDTGYYINEEFSKETLETRKENWKKVKVLRKNGNMLY